MKLTERTLTALKGSIDHWERMANGEFQKDEEPGPDHCPLCALFIGDACENCPIKNKTGSQYCRRTPYQDAEDEFGQRGKFSPEFQAAARKELEFLKSLLPTAE